jgi:hypothetical protein
LQVIGLENRHEPAYIQFKQIVVALLVKILKLAKINFGMRSKKLVIQKLPIII